MSFSFPKVLRNARICIIAVSALFILAACSSTTMSGQGLAEANRLYEAGQLTEAVAAYEALVAAGANDGTLYYNLGNAYFKIGDLGRAILNYRRAQRLLPRDPDVAANLALARTQAQDRLEVEGQQGLVAFIEHTLVGWMTPDEAAQLALGLWIILCAIGVAWIVRPQWRHALVYALAVIAVLWGLALISLGLRMLDARRAPAVIVAESAEIRSGPGTDYLTEFTLHAGAEVRVIEERAGWTRIALPGDLQGWLPGERVQQVASFREFP